MIKSAYIIVLSLVLVASTCDKEKKSKDSSFYLGNYEIPYSLDLPNQIMVLERELTEISGLTYSPKKNILYCINDERGNVYGLNPKNGKIVDRIFFGKPDDYEGISYYNNFIYVVESNGNVKVINEELSERHKAYKSALSRRNDIEGLVYYPANKSLLLAAKENSRLNENVSAEKAIFSMNLEDGKVDAKPFIAIDLLNASMKFQSELVDNESSTYQTSRNRINDFAPSGIAIHPKTNDFYILSSRGKLLVILNAEGVVKAIYFLDEMKHLQPEGICFTPDGTLYISNEGKGKKALIYSYESNL